MPEKRRYAAKLVFFTPNSLEGNSFYELRTVLTHAANAQEALAAFKEKGEEENRDDENEDGSRSICRFEGIQEMLCLEYAPGIPFDEDEVWYDIVECKRPKNMKIPPENKLNAIYWEEQGLG